MIKKQIPNIEDPNAILNILIDDNSLNISSQEDMNYFFPDLGKPLFGSRILYELSSLNLERNFIDEILEIDINNSKICIMGDYDVDGIMATIIMHNALSRLGYNVSYYIPDRLKEGYGMNISCLENPRVQEADVLITVDNGISCKDVIDSAINIYGKKVIVTDHHLPTQGLLPENCLVIDPHINGDVFPDICGAVVALKLTHALYKYFGVNYPFNDLFPLAGIATIADMMPLINENRYIVKGTLDMIDMCKTDSVGLRFLRQVIRNVGGFNFIEKEPDSVASEGLLSFYIAPTINAVSRVQGNVNNFVGELLDSLNFGTFIKSKVGLNIERKKITQSLLDTLNTALKTIESSGNSFNTLVYAYNKKEFNDDIKGVLGLIANKITDKLNKPALIGSYMPDENGYISEVDYSGRSIPGYDLHAGIERIKLKYPELNIRGGGHALAMGLKINCNGDLENHKLLMTALEEDFINNATTIERTAYIFEADKASEIINGVYKFAPYGQGLKSITFVYTGKFYDFNEVTKDATIGDYVFKFFAAEEDLKLIGKDVDVYFNICFENVRYSTFRCKEIKEV